MIDYKQLIKKAFEAREKAYTPYSNFRVGAALLGEDGKVYTGCNIESATFTPTICAERTAFANAVSQGIRRFTAIAVVGGPESTENLDLCPPCGVCRQFMAEFCLPKEFQIVLTKSENEYVVKTLDELLPMSFGPERLRKQK